ncbi:MAG: hypothetical protein ACI9DC_000269 [Gammaproteobacteria bacterium]|jgi:hypothetical protein
MKAIGYTSVGPIDREKPRLPKPRRYRSPR